MMGTLTVCQDGGAETTPIANLFIDEYMCEANDAQLKVYLYLVRTMLAGRSTTISEMADRFNHTEKDVLRALLYWEKNGLLSLEYGEGHTLRGIHLCSAGELREKCAGSGSCALLITPQEGASLTGRTAERRFDGDEMPPADGAGKTERAEQAAAQSGRPAASGRVTPFTKGPEAAAIESFRADRARGQLLFIVEQYIGKPLAVAEIRSLYHICEELRFSDDLVDYLVQYCIDRGKKDFRYIVRVADNWAQNGVTTPQQAEKAPALRELTARAARPRAAKVNRFNQFEQRDYDFDALEKELLSN